MGYYPNKKHRIKDLPTTQRPREKLLNNGAENLKDKELLAILIGTGVPKQNAVIVAEKLLRRYPLQKLVHAGINDLKSIHGIGASKAARVVGAIELGARIFSPSLTKIVIRSTGDIVHQVRDIAERKQEYLVALYLNARHELLQKEVVGVGILNTALVEPKEIFRHALSSACAEIIIAHNHPSGDPTPSEEDIAFSDRLQKAGEIMGIPLLDHIIIARSSYFSFRNNAVVK